MSRPPRASSAPVWLAFPALLLAVLIAYQPAWHGGVLWDDERHLTSVDLQGLGGLGRIWFEIGATQQYYPLLHSAFWVLHRFFGDSTLGYHLVNIGLHAGSAFLLLLILRRLSAPGAELAAVIFALHPVHVESVAWIAELKNTLSGVMYLGSALAYVHFDDMRRARSYVLSLVLFVLALLTKSVTAVLPVIIALALWWRHGRLSWGRDLVPLVPFVALGTVAGIVTAWIERTLLKAEGSEFAFTFIDRCLIAGRVIWFYLGKLVWPTALLFNYPRWQIDAMAWRQYVYPVAAVCVLLGLWAIRSRRRAPLAAMLMFCASLVPVLGFLNVYPFRYSFVADHFQYLASIPIIALCAAGVASAAEWVRAPRRIATAVAIVVLGVPLALLTNRQSRQYVDAETLYRATLAENPSSLLAHVNLGILRLGEDVHDAAAHFEQAIRLRPDVAEGHNNLGLALERMGKPARAIEKYKEAIRLKPELAEAHNNLCRTLVQVGEPAAAAPACAAALRLNPRYVEAHYTLGIVAQMQGESEAIGHFRTALQLKPDLADAHNRIGNVLHQMGQSDAALAEYREAARIDPRLADAHNNLGIVLQSLGRRDEALSEYRLALENKPTFADAHFNLANLLQSYGQMAEAVDHYKAVLKYNPQDAVAHNNLSVALARLGRFDEAAAEYNEAVRLNPKLAIRSGRPARPLSASKPSKDNED